MTTEAELLAAIKEADSEQEDARKQFAFHKRAVLQAETRLIEANLKREALAEQLRVYHNTTVNHELSLRDKEIEAFRDKMEDYKKRGLL